jgi:MFS family permease
MWIDDGRARQIGWVTLGMVIAGPLAGFAILLLSEAGISLDGWKTAVLVGGVPLAGCLIAFVAMCAHQAHANLTKADLDAWERRSTRRSQGGLVPVLQTVAFPFIYLLASPEQRRLRRYLHRR